MLYKFTIPSINDVKLLKVPKISDERGSLTFLENNVHFPFGVERVFYLYDIHSGESRGAHAHKECQHFLIAIHGSFDVIVDDGRRKKTFHLNSPDEGLYVPSMIWDEETNFSKGAVCLVLASHAYDESDYIRKYEDYLAFQAPF